MGLREQAIRLMRTNWSGKEQLLAEELYLILLQATDPTTGPITIDPGDGTGPFQLPPTPDLQIPDFDLPDFTSNPNTPREEVEEVDEDQGNLFIRRRVEVQWVRTGGIPGLILGQASDGTYNVRLYPNGSQATNDEGDPEFVDVDGVRQIQIADGETVPAGNWVTGGVYRATKLEVTTEELVRAGGTGMQNEVPVGKRTHVKILSRTHDMQVPVWLSAS